MSILSRAIASHSVVVLASFALVPNSVGASPYAAINAAAAADPIKVQRLRGGVAMLSGSGGNIGVLASRDGLLLVDAGIAVSRKKIENALRSVGRGPVKFVVNTHWHWDHTDGNGWLRRLGATVIADQHAVRRLGQTIRIVEWEHTFTPIPKRDLPNEVLSTGKVISFGKEKVAIRHYRPGHTDGDMAVYFQRADILQTGDTFWNGMYPFIDYVGGGGIDGAIRAADANIAAARPGTIIIPGHGPVGNRAQLVQFRNMLVTVRAKVAALKASGRSADQVVAARPTANLDAKWGRSVISGDLFTRLVYQGV